jgi:hypothetical protein
MLVNQIFLFFQMKMAAAVIARASYIITGMLQHQLDVITGRPKHENMRLCNGHRKNFSKVIQMTDGILFCVKNSHQTGIMLMDHHHRLKIGPRRGGDTEEWTHFRYGSPCDYQIA